MSMELVTIEATGVSTSGAYNEAVKKLADYLVNNTEYLELLCECSNGSILTFAGSDLKVGIYYNNYIQIAIGYVESTEDSENNVVTQFLKNVICTQPHNEIYMSYKSVGSNTVATLKFNAIKNGKTIYITYNNSTRSGFAIASDKNGVMYLFNDNSIVTKDGKVMTVVNIISNNLAYSDRILMLPLSPLSNSLIENIQIENMYYYRDDNSLAANTKIEIDGKIYYVMQGKMMICITEEG